MTLKTNKPKSFLSCNMKSELQSGCCLKMPADCNKLAVINERREVIKIVCVARAAKKFQCGLAAQYAVKYFFNFTE